MAAADHASVCTCPAEFEAFAFQDADDYSLEEFEGIAATFEEQWFGADRDKVRFTDWSLCVGVISHCVAW